MNQTEEVARLTAVKAALTGTTRTPGWVFARKIADNVVKAAIQAAMDEEDSAIGESKRLKAKALQKGFHDYFAAIEAAISFDPKQFQDQSGLGDLEDAI